MGQFQMRNPYVFLSFASEDSDWVQDFRSVKGFQQKLNAAKTYNYVADPEMVRDLKVVADEVKKSDIFFALLSQYYLPKQLTLLEFKTAVERSAYDSGSPLLLVLVMLDEEALTWWSEHRGTLPKSLHDKAYTDFKDKTEDRPVELTTAQRYKVLRLATKAREEWERVAAMEPRQSSNVKVAAPERDIVLMGHPEATFESAVTCGLEEVARLLTERGKKVQRWPDQWSVANNGPPKEEVDSLIERGSDFIRAVEAKEASLVAKGADLRSELVTQDEPASPNADPSPPPLKQSRLIIWLPSIIPCPPFEAKVASTS